MTLVPYTRGQMPNIVNNVTSAAEDGSQLRIAWRNVDDEEWQQSLVAPFFNRQGALQVRIVEGDDEGARYSFPLRGVQYAALTAAQTMAETNLVHAQTIHHAQRQLSGERRAHQDNLRQLSGDRRAHHDEASSDWRRIKTREHEIEHQLSQTALALQEREDALQSQRRELIDRAQEEQFRADERASELERQRQRFFHERDTLEDVLANRDTAEQERNHAVQALQVSNEGNAQARSRLRKLQEEIAALRESAKIKLSDFEKSCQSQLDEAKRTNATEVLRLQEELKKLKTSKKDMQTSSLSFPRMGSSVKRDNDDYARVVEENRLLQQELADWKSKQPKLPSKAKNPSVRESDDENDSPSDDEHSGATDEENESSCRTALQWWEKKEMFLEFSDRATSAFLADKLSLEVFDEAWRRRLKLKSTSKEYLNALVEDMLRRLRLSLRVVRLGAPSAVAAYAQRKSLRDALESAARLELTISGASSKDFEKFNSTLRKARAKNRSKKNEFFGLDAVVAEVRTSMKSPKTRNDGGRKWGGPKTPTTPRPQSPKPS